MAVDPLRAAAMASPGLAGADLLFVTTYPPEDSGLGGAAFVDSAQIAALRSAGHRITVFPVTGPDLPVSVQGHPGLIVRSAARAAIRREPVALAKFQAGRAWSQRVVALRAAAQRVDRVITSQTPALLLARSAGIRPDVHIAHNVDTVLTEAHAPRLLRRLGETERARRHERELLSLPHRVAALAPADAAVLALWRGSEVLSLDLAIPPAATRRPAGPRCLGFIGKLSWGPNQRALQTLIAEVMPEVRTRLADHPPTLTVAGRGAVTVPPWVRFLGPIATVDRFYAEVDLVAVPRLAASTGVSVKLLEAASRGIAVVAPAGLLAGAGVSTYARAADSVPDVVDAIVSFYSTPGWGAAPDAVAAPRVPLGALLAA